MSGGIRLGSFNVPTIVDPEGRVIDPDELVRQQLAQPGRNRAYCKVYMNGQDITSQLDPLLLSVRITDKKMGASVASLTIDDSYAKVPSPPDGSKCAIALGWPNEGSTKSFFGSLSNVVSSGQRQQGRTLDVEFTSYDVGGPGKTPITMTWGQGKDAPDGKGEDVPFSKVAKELADKAGIKNFNVAGAIGAMTRKNWSVQNENPLGALERLSKELGASFKVDGDNAGITAIGSGVSAIGDALTTNRAVIGENVLAWRIIPSVRRAQWGEFAHGFFDRDKAAQLIGKSDAQSAFGFAKVAAKRMGAWPTNDAEMAKTLGKADASVSVQKRGTGWVVCDGMPTAMAGGKLDLNGAKPSVDGKYTNEEVEHSYFRGGGFTTRIDVEDPELYDTGSISRRFQGAPD